MLKNALIYRIEHWDQPSLAEIAERLSGSPFVECGLTQPESAGWVAPRGDKHDALAEIVGGQLVVKLCAERRAVPGSAVKQATAGAARRHRAADRPPPQGQAAQGAEGGRGACADAARLPQAHRHAGLDRPRARMVWVGAGSTKRGDVVVTRLIECLGGGLKLALLQTELSPATAMSLWLSEKEAPSGFSIDRECELKQPDSEKATVRYARHTLDIDEVGEHIRQGKLPTQLALTWASRVSFVLTEALTLKKIQLLDVVLEGAGVDAANAGKDDNGFDADVAIATGELRLMLPALIEALGGLHERQAAAAPAALPDAGAEDAAPWETAAA